MSVIATAVKHLMLAGITGDALLNAIAELEANLLAEARAEPKARSKAAIRQERYAARKKAQAEASESVSNDVLASATVSNDVLASATVSNDVLPAAAPLSFPPNENKSNPPIHTPGTNPARVKPADFDIDAAGSGKLGCLDDTGSAIDETGCPEKVGSVEAGSAENGGSIVGQPDIDAAGNADAAGSGEAAPDIDGAGKSPRKRASRAKRAGNPAEVPGDLLPDGWQPNLTARIAAIVEKWPEGMFDRELIAFEANAATKQIKSLDWQASFRTWVCNAEKWKTEDATRGQANRNRIASNRRADAPDGFRAVLEQRSSAALRAFNG